MKYQAFNMSYDYNANVKCPYGCPSKLREEQLLLHITKCWRKNDELFGHCKYNYIHIYPHSYLAQHETTCTSNVPMTEEDFHYKPENDNLQVNLNWILSDDLSKKYASYFNFGTELPEQVESSQGSSVQTLASEEIKESQDVPQLISKEEQTCDSLQSQTIPCDEGKEEQNPTKFQLKNQDITQFILGSIENTDQDEIVETKSIIQNEPTSSNFVVQIFKNLIEIFKRFW